MAIKPSQILAKLQTKQADFQSFDRAASQLLRHYRQALHELSQISSAELEGQLAAHSLSALGAVPLEPLGSDLDWVKPSRLNWSSRDQSLAWVRDRLTGITTFAVDGSQIFPSKDLSIPVALVQVGWFENPHRSDGHYAKDIVVDIMTPTELKASNSGDLVDRQVNMRRFQMEVDRLLQAMQEHPHAENYLVFFDGSLIVTFAEAFDEEVRHFYSQSMVKLLQASEYYRVPLVGYIDTTYARDLTTLIQTVTELPDQRSIHDALLLHPPMQWGDRTPLFRCARSGILAAYGDQQHQITFTYLKAHEGYPVRLELPLWVYESERLEQIIDWVRAEVIIGSGYPYVIETADQTAVLQASDRQTFYTLFQDWAAEANLDLRLSRKMVSKARRR